MAKYTLDQLRDEYRDLWARMEVVKIAAAQAQAKRVIANKDRYKEVESETGVPWFVVGCLHMRESSGDFATYLGNGQPLNRKTTIVPKGRGPWRTFEDGAYDALVNVEGLHKIKDWGPEHVAYAMEKFNGFGYRASSRDIPSPYLWGGTSVQKRGKFVRDGVYDPDVMDPQIGGMAVLRQIMALDPEAKFKTAEPVPAPPDVPSPDKPDEPRPSLLKRFWMWITGGGIGAAGIGFTDWRALLVLAIFLLIAGGLVVWFMGPERVRAWVRRQVN